MSRRRLLVAALAVALTIVPAATAKVWFLSVGGDTYRVGTVVQTKIAGCPDPCPVRGTRVALAPTTSLRTSRFLGAVDRRGVLVFRVPLVASGRYVLVAHGRRVSDPFRIVAG